MTPKEMYKEIKLRYSFNSFSNLTDRERKIYRTGFRTGYKLARQFFKNNIASFLGKYLPLLQFLLNNIFASFLLIFFVTIRFLYT